MMNAETLKTIQDCGEVEMPIHETCVIAEITESEFLQDSEARMAYTKGQLISKFKIRQSVVKMAKEGVPQMVKIYQEFGNVVLPVMRLPVEKEYNCDIDLPGDFDE